MTLDPAKFKVVLAPAILLAALVGVWKAGVAWTEFRQDLNANFTKLEFAIRDTRTEFTTEIKDKTSDRWTASQMKDWAYQLERDNRDAKIAVPSIAASKP